MLTIWAMVGAVHTYTHTQSLVDVHRTNLYVIVLHRIATHMNDTLLLYT